MQAYNPTIWYFKKLFFLLEHVQLRQAVDSLSHNPETYEEVEYHVGTDGVLEELNSQEISETENCSEGSMLSCATETLINVETPSTQKSKKKRSEQSVEENLMSQASTMLASISSTIQQNVDSHPKKIDANEAFANYIISKLNCITDENIRMETEEQITTILFNAIKICKNQ